jgi:hypothetical protein
MDGLVHGLVVSNCNERYADVNLQQYGLITLVRLLHMVDVFLGCARRAAGEVLNGARPRRLPDAAV